MVACFHAAAEIYQKLLMIYKNDELCMYVQVCAGEQAAAVAKKVPAPETRSREELAAASIRELKAVLAEHGVSAAGAAEKDDLVDLVLERCR